MSKRPHELGIHGTVDMYRCGECRCEPCTAAFMLSVPHGTLSGSRHHGCSCDRCVAARRQYGRAHSWTRRSIRGGAAEPPLPPSPRTKWSVEQIRLALRAYYDTHGALPNRKSTEGLQGSSWGAAQKWLRGRGLTFRGLLGMSAWREHSSAEFEWSAEAIYAVACAYCVRSGRWPTSKDGAVTEFGGRTWGRANGWLRGQGFTLATLADAMRQAEGSQGSARRSPAGSESPLRRPGARGP